MIRSIRLPAKRGDFFRGFELEGTGEEDLAEAVRHPKSRERISQEGNGHHIHPVQCVGRFEIQMHDG